MQAEQNEHKNIPWGAVRLVTDWELMLCEHALRCLLNPPREAGFWLELAPADLRSPTDANFDSG
jgi:hypothetical protein